MSVLQGAKQEIADLISAEGVKAFAEDPRSSTSNIVVVEPDDPYIEDRDTFAGQYTVNFTATVIGPPITNANCWSVLDSMIEKVVVALGNFSLRVPAPGVHIAGNATYVACVISVSTNITINKEVI